MTLVTTAHDMSLGFDDLMEKKISKIEGCGEGREIGLGSHRSGGLMGDLEEIGGLMGGNSPCQIGDGVYFGVIDGKDAEAEIGNWNCFYREIDESL